MFIRIALCLLLIPSMALASDLRTKQSALYTYQNSVQLQEEFVSGGITTTTIGTYGWGFSNGTVNHQNSVANRAGILRRDTSAVSGTLTSLFLLSNNFTTFNPASPTIFKWITRLNTNDANTTVRVGLSNSASANPPANGIYLEKLDADTNWFCITRNATVQTRTDSGVAVTTNFFTESVTINSSGVQFSIDGVNVCSLMTSNIPTTFIIPFTHLINSAAASKTLDHDYFEISVSGLSR